MMTETGKKLARGALLLFVLLLAAQMIGVAALADDETLPRVLPEAEWAFAASVDPEDVNAQMADLAFVKFGKDGKLTVRCNQRDGSPLCVYEGTWMFEFVPEATDRLTLVFTATDHADHAGAEYRVECVYDCYMEGWEENSVKHRDLILEESRSSGVSPFVEVYGEDAVGSLALSLAHGPDTKIVNCKDYVSLRAKRSTSSTRLTKVPLGAMVLAFPEYGDENGFIMCEYQGKTGYILAEYLELPE